MKRIGTLLILVFLGLVVSHRMPTVEADPEKSLLQTQPQDLQKPIEDVRAQIRQWELSAETQVSLIVAVIVFGALIGGFHRSNNAWAKHAILVLGIGTSIATSINSSNAVFTADYRSLRQAVSEGNRVVARMDGIAATNNLRNMSNLEFAVVKQQMDAQLDIFDKIAQRIEGSGTRNPPTPPFWVLELPTVKAQSAESTPAWVGSRPTDSRNLYFIGTGTDVSLVTAKDNSLTDAENQLTQAFELGLPYVSTDARRTLIRSSYTIQDTFFRSNAGGSSFTFYTLLRISRDLQRMQASPLVYKQNGWRPADLTFNSTAGMMVLDDDGRIFRITVDERGIHLERLFQIPPGYRRAATAATQDAIFVSSNSEVGCSIFQYSLATRKVTQKNIGKVWGECDGIASDGSGLFLAMTGRQEVRYWTNWGYSSFQTFSLPESSSNCVLDFDVLGQRLIYAGPTGVSFVLSPSTGKWLFLASNLGYVQSISTSNDHILFASGNKVLFYARSNSMGENPPASINGRLISGVAVDSSGAAWVTDYQNSSVSGPFPLNE